MSVQHGDALLHLWVECEGQVVDDPEIRNKVRTGLLDIYKYGRHDLQYENMWGMLIECGFSEDLRKT